jgi:hypothetical protein
MMQAALKIAAKTLFISALIGAPAFAQEKGHRLAACKPDIDKFCASEPHGHGKIRACLEANKDKLAPECKTALEKAAREKSQ